MRGPQGEGPSVRAQRPKWLVTSKVTSVGKGFEGWGLKDFHFEECELRSVILIDIDAALTVPTVSLSAATCLDQGLEFGVALSWLALWQLTKYWNKSEHMVCHRSRRLDPICSSCGPYLFTSF